MIKKTFQDWTYEDVEEVFDIRLIQNDLLAQAWLSAKYEFSEIEKTEITVFSTLLSKQVHSWNEDELRFSFVSPLLNFVDYNLDKYRLFSNRKITAIFENENYTVSGYIKTMLAKGKLNPKQVYFLVQSYKPENAFFIKGNKRNVYNDPLGQVLIAMVVARQYNEQKFPIYGCYVNGRNWFFVVLHDDTYSVSRAYDATDIIDLQQILASLIDIKRIIEPFL